MSEFQYIENVLLSWADYYIIEFTGEELFKKRNDLYWGVARQQGDAANLGKVQKITPIPGQLCMIQYQH